MALFYALLALSSLFASVLRNNRLLAGLPFPLEEVLDHQEQLKVECEKFMKLSLSVTTQDTLCEARFILLQPKYEEAVRTSSIAKFTEVATLDYRVFNSVPSPNFLFSCQQQSFSLGNTELIKQIHDLSIRLDSFDKSDDVAQVGKVQLQQAKDFIADYNERPEVHYQLKQELFKVPSGFHEAVAFSTKQMLLRVDMLKRAIKMLSELKTTNKDQLLQHTYTALLMQIDIGRKLSSIQHLRWLKKDFEQGNLRILTEYLSSMMHSLNTGEFILPESFRKYLDGLEPFSSEWMYIKFRLVSYESYSILASNSLIEKKFVPFIRTHRPLFFLIGCRVITALRPYVCKFGKAGLPYLLYCNDDGLTNFVANEVQTQLEKLLRPKVNAIHKSNPKDLARLQASYFLSLPLEFQNIVAKRHFDFFLELSPTEFASLTDVPKKKKRSNKKKNTNKINAQLIVPVDSNEFKIMKDSTETENQHVENTMTEQIESGLESTIAQAIDNCAEATSDSMSKRPKKILLRKESEEARLVPKPLPEINMTQDLVIIDVEYDEAEANEWARIYQQQLDSFSKKIKDLPRVDTISSGSSAKIISFPDNPNKGNTVVAKWCTNDFMDLFPEANILYHHNLNSDTANFALNSHGLQFHWIFNPKIVISSETFKFLCQVFGLLPGRKAMSFLNFQRAFFEITGGPTAQAGSKNRTVFCFPHSFMVDGRIFIPPIKGVHPEHLSSGFNHIQVREFLENGGQHPYFYEII